MSVYKLGKVTHKRGIRGLSFLLFFLISCQPTDQNINWPGYLGDKASSQYSPLAQINRANVSKLSVAWTYRTGDADPENRSQIQCNPLIIDGVLFGSSPRLAFFALDAATGEELWTFNPFDEDFDMFGMGVNRGLAYWEKEDDTRLLITAGANLFAVNARDGQPIKTFGDNGKVDLHEGLGRKVDDRFVSANSPGIIFEDLLILGARVSEEKGAAPGHIRAYNVLTGEMAWIFHTIPKPEEFGAETWPENAWNEIGGANAWCGMSLDEKRGVVYIPTGSASYDFYGADRPGENLFANCILALNARTGERIWHFQTIRHDLWDRDLPAPPNLVTVRHEGKKIDALAQITKSGYVFLLNRDTGEPLFPIEEIPSPKSDLPNEQSWPSQPLPTKPPPFARQFLTADNVTDISQASHDYVKKILSTTRTGQQFIPPSEEGTVIFPGFDGGGEWGGAAVDPATGILYVNANEMPWILTMVQVRNDKSNLAFNRGEGLYRQYCGGCHGIDKKGGSFMGTVPPLTDIKEKYGPDEFRQILQNGKGAMPIFSWLAPWQIESLEAYLFELKDLTLDTEGLAATQPEESTYTSTGYIRFKDPDGYPAVKPPWGTLNAIDLNKGEILWQVPLGEFKELTAKGIPVTGTENYGGPIVTKSGLLFIGASQDEMFRAFDIKNGKILWEYQLPAGGYATPSSYQVKGKQYVVIACGGGKMGTNSGDAYVAFALP